MSLGEEHGRLSVADTPPLSSEIIRQLATLQILPIVWAHVRAFKTGDFDGRQAEIPLPQFPLWVEAASTGGLSSSRFLLPRLSRAVLPQTMCGLREGQDQSQRQNLPSAVLSSRTAEMACFVPVSGAGWTIIHDV